MDLAEKVSIVAVAAGGRRHVWLCATKLLVKVTEEVRGQANDGMRPGDSGEVTEMRRSSRVP
jgi:hypothetical protein